MRPKVICHIMSSVDGRLLPDRWTAPFDGTNPSELFKEYAAIGNSLDTDAWMFGKATTREVFPYKYMSKGTAVGIEKVFVGNRNTPRLFITIDPDADIFFTADKLRGDNILTVLGTDATTDYLSELEARGISYIVVDNPKNLNKIMEIIHDKFGVECILHQGGGIIGGAFLILGDDTGDAFKGVHKVHTGGAGFPMIGAIDFFDTMSHSLPVPTPDCHVWAQKKGQADYIAPLQPPYRCFDQDLAEFRGSMPCRTYPTQKYKLFHISPTLSRFFQFFLL